MQVPVLPKDGELPDAAVTLDQVTKRFGRITAVENLSLTVRKGRTTAILGPSGCGKTTILKMIAGFEHPEEGSIHIAGVNVSDARPYERNVGLVFQDYALFPHMTVGENIAYGLKRRDVARADIVERTRRILELVDLAGFENRWTSTLSGGQQQRVALARALVIEPAVALLDEPMSALDAKLRQELRGALKGVLRALNATTILVTHDQHEAMSLADQLIVMYRGKIMQEGSPTEVYLNPENRFVAEFLGRSNWFEGNLGAAHDAFYNDFHAGDVALRVTKPTLNASRYDVCVRPERIKVELPGTAGKNADENLNLLTGWIVSTEQLGGVIEYVVRLSSGQHISATQHEIVTNAESMVGMPVRLAFSASDCRCVPVSGS